MKKEKQKKKRSIEKYFKKQPPIFLEISTGKLIVPSPQMRLNAWFPSPMLVSPSDYFPLIEDLLFCF